MTREEGRGRTGKEGWNREGGEKKGGSEVAK